MFVSCRDTGIHLACGPLLTYIVSVLWLRIDCKRTTGQVSVNVNVQGSGIRRGIIKHNLVSTSACDKCSAEKPPYETVLSRDRSTFAEEQKAEVVGYLSCWKFYSFPCNALNHLFYERFSAKYYIWKSRHSSAPFGALSTTLRQL